MATVEATEAVGDVPLSHTRDSTPDLDRRFGGLERLYGVEGARRVRNACVVVVGVGGVGSWTAEALARSGVGHLVLIDMDHVSESNINRQIHALTLTLGQAKVRAMQDRILQIHPECRVDVIEDFATADNWHGLVPAHVSAVVEACDQVRTKAAICAWARAQGVGGPAFVTVGAAGGKRLAHKVDVEDLVRITHDPLLAQVRYRLRRGYGAPRDGAAFDVAGVYSRESVAQPDASCAVDGDGSLNCHGYGSVVAVTATFGMVAAGWILDRIARGKSATAAAL